MTVKACGQIGFFSLNFLCLLDFITSVNFIFVSMFIYLSLKDFISNLTSFPKSRLYIIVDWIVTTSWSWLIFVCLCGIFVPLENFSLIWRRHNYRRRASIFDLCSALMVIEQWGFYSVPHLLWHGSPVYYGYFRGPVTPTSVAKCLAVELSLLVLSTQVKQPTYRMRGERSIRLRRRRGLKVGVA